jgi:hypothetical protein
MNYENEINSALTDLGLKKGMTINFLSKLFKLNHKRTKNVLSKILNKQIGSNQVIDNIILIKNRDYLIPSLLRERNKYLDFLKSEQKRLSDLQKNLILFEY